MSETKYYGKECVSNDQFNCYTHNNRQEVLFNCLGREDFSTLTKRSEIYMYNIINQSEYHHFQFLNHQQF